MYQTNVSIRCLKKDRTNLCDAAKNIFKETAASISSATPCRNLVPSIGHVNVNEK